MGVKNTNMTTVTKYFNLSYLKTIIIILYFISIPLTIQTLQAQDTTILRPRIGLALSGGGSHGLAHIGVLKVMEEAGLRPDYITGVSMGSIIGGFYAMGYSPDSMQTLFKRIDWDMVLSDLIPENKIIFQEKRHFHNSILALPITTKKIVIPTGLIKGQQVENFLNYYGWPAADINDFSKLPIPFLCVGTDIIKGDKIILKSGYLPDALRGSIAVPSIFTPNKIDSMMVVDGGVIRNFAVTELVDMGADIVIGSYTGATHHDASNVESIDGILKQVVFFPSIRDYDEEKKRVDILIEPVTSGFSIMTFNDVDSLVQRGYKAALPYKEKFRKLADSLNMICPQKPLEKIMNKQLYSFDRIEVTGNKIHSDEQIIGILDISPGEKINKDLLRDKMDLLYGKAWFDKVKYRFDPNGDSLILAIDCEEIPKAILYGSLHYDDAIGSGILLEISVKNLITPKSVINIDSYISQYYRLRFNAVQFIDHNEKFGLAVDLFAEDTPLPMITLRGESGKMLSLNFTAGISVNKRLGLNHMMSLSEEFENLNLVPDFITRSNLNSLSYNYLTTSFEYLANTLDNKHFPVRGIVYSISAGSSKLLSGTLRTDSIDVTYDDENVADFSFNRFYKVQGSFRYYFPVSKRTTFSIRGDALYISNTDSISAHNNFSLLGGVVPVNKRSIQMAGFHSNEIPVRNLAGLGAGLDIKILRSLYLNFMCDVFTIQEPDREKGFSLLGGYSIGAGYMSVVGPIKVGLMQGIYERETFFKPVKGYVTIGFNF